MAHCVVSLSGGMDSSTLLLRAIEEYDTVTGKLHTYITNGWLGTDVTEVATVMGVVPGTEYGWHPNWAAPTNMFATSPYIIYKAWGYNG